MIPQRKKRNSSKVNLVISLVFHSALIVAIFFLAAREGMLGKKLKELTVTMVPKEKKPEPPKEKPPEPKVEQAKQETPKTVLPPAPKVETAVAPPPAANLAPAVAPSSGELPAFEFHDGAHEVATVSDPNGIYKALVEHSLRSRWNRPEDMADDDFTADVELTVDRKGNIADTRWVKGSGNARWDDSVKAAVKATTALNRPPPKGFPEKFLVRFDVESMRTEPLPQLTVR